MSVRELCLTHINDKFDIQLLLSYCVSLTANSYLNKACNKSSLTVVFEKHYMLKLQSNLLYKLR